MHKATRNRKKMCLITVLFFSITPVFSGCGAETDQSGNDGTAIDSMVIVDHPEEAPVYITAPVAYDDVVKTAKILCTYKQTEEYDITTSMIGKKIEEIYVEQGDTVTKGQLIAKLSGGDIQGSIDELEYKIARNKLLLEHLDAEENEALSYRWWTFLYQSSLSEADRESLDKSIEAIQREYRYRREDCEDTIRLDRQQLEICRQELNQYFIHADMDGEISRVNNYLVGQTLTKETVLAQIFDKSQCVFESSQTEYAYCFQEGESAELSVKVEGNTLILDVLPLNMDNWDEKLVFSIPSLNTDTIPLAALGNIIVTADSRQHVLTVPNGAVHNARNGNKYVYTLGENDVREVRWVETGLRGDSLTEIISGLAEGELVLLK